MAESFEDTNNSIFYCTTGFLRDPKKELNIYDSIAQKNLRAIQQRKETIISGITTLLSDSNADKDTFNKFVQIKKENVVNASECHKKLLESISVTNNIKKKKNSILALEEKLKQLTQEYEKLKIEKERQKKEDRASIKIFQEAVNYYNKYFQLTTDKGQHSKYPIRFTFNKEIDTLISFDAGNLLTKQQHEVLNQRFKETSNYLALFSTLRHGAFLVHKP